MIELLVGIAVGLMVVTAALGTLVLSRTTASAINDQLELQQQANMAMRIMSGQLREANTRELVAQGGGTMVVFTAMPVYNGDPLSLVALRGLARDAQDNDNFGVAFADAGAPAPTQDCLGNTNLAGGPLDGVRIDNRFYVAANRLMCMGTNVATGAQPLVSDVQRFRVLYGIQNNAVVPPTMTYLTQAAVPDWTTANVVALELCLELATAQRGAPAVGNYVDCDGNNRAQDGRVRAVVRQVVRMRAVPVA